METKKKEYNYYCKETNSIQITDDYDVYNKSMESYRFLLARKNSGGDTGIHFPKHSTDVSVYRHDPPLQVDPNL